MKRTLALGAAWTASAAAAVGMGFLVVSLVDADASPATTLSVATAPSTTSSAPSTGTSSPVDPPALPPATAEYPTLGGTVFADCATGSPVLAGVPAAGWYVDDSLDPGEMEFKRGEERVEVLVHCADGAPSFTPDDSDGRHGGGHGSDDGVGDDSTGRYGGAHGADDGPGDDPSGRDGGGYGSIG